MFDKSRNGFAQLDPLYSLSLSPFSVSRFEFGLVRQVSDSFYRDALSH